MMECPDCDGDGVVGQDLAVCDRCKGTGQVSEPVTKTVVIRGGRQVEVTTYPAGRETR